MAMKRGFFFSTDAILAFFTVIAGILAISVLYTHSQPKAQIDYLPQDVVRMLSAVKVSELDNEYLLLLIENGTLSEKEFDNTIIEAAGLLWVKNQASAATLLLQNITDKLVPSRFGLEIVIGNETMHYRSSLREQQVSAYRSMITGLEKTRPIRGTSARIFLTGGEERLIRSSYVYFGGFEGQGNITKILRRIPADANITKIYLEVSAASNFTISINGIHCMDLTVSSTPMTADAFDLTSCKDSLIPGSDNIFMLNFSELESDRAYVGGGLLRADYFTEEVFYKDMNSARYDFPGISGIINLYSAFDVPGQLNSMEAYLHYDANHTNATNNTISLVIGGTLVYSDNSSNETVSVLLNSTNISSKIDFASISNQTVPLRFGFENLTFITTASDRGNGDVAVVNDVSGSMNWNFTSNSAGQERFCKQTLLKTASSQRLSVLKCIMKDFIEQIVTNISGNRMGMVSYSSTVRDVTPLSRNSTLLIDGINQYYASGGTCTSCGVYRAVQELMAGQLTDLLHNTWHYTNSYQEIEPAGFSMPSYDDSEWLTGKMPFGIGRGAAFYSGSISQVNLWPLQGDKDAPVDFTRGINSIRNTFGLPTLITHAPLANSRFTGPSASEWSLSGAIAPEPFRIRNLMFDSFNRANNNNIGANWTEVANGGNWVIYNNYLVESTNGYIGTRDEGVGPIAYNNQGLAWSDYTVTSRIRPNDNDGMGLLFRYQDNQNHYRLRIDNDDWGGRFTRLERIQGGVRTVLWENPGSSFGFSEDSWNEMSIEVKGSTIRAYRGTTLIAEASDTAFQTGTVAAYSWAMDDGSYGADFDWINVTQNVFGLSDYMVINHTTGGTGYASQDFTSPAANPSSAVLVFNYSTNDFLLPNWAEVFCNITHPFGETSVFKTNVTSANNSAGPEQEDIDITPLIVSDSFTYSVKCGATVGPGSFAAIDDVFISINYTPSSGDYDDGWDYKEGVFGYDGDNAEFFPLSRGDLEIVINGTNGVSGSGAWGIQFNVTDEMADMLSSPGGKALVSFDYRWDPGDGAASGIFASSDEVWVKGYLENTSGYRRYLGQESSSVDGDIGFEIWSADDPDSERSFRYTEDVSSFLKHAGVYYLGLGGRLQRNSTAKVGSFSFDNIQIVFTNKSGNTYYRNRFFVFNITNINNPLYLNITSDNGTECYLNGNLIDSYDTAVQNRITAVNTALLFGGENILAIKLKNNDSQGYLQAMLMVNETKRQKALVIMSDGETNACVGAGGISDSGCDDCGGRGCCPGPTGALNTPCPNLPQIIQSEFQDGTERAAEQLINLTCYYQSLHNFSVYTVIFGDVAIGGKKTLNMTALCDPEYTSENTTHYFQSEDPAGLYSIYQEIAMKLRNSFSNKLLQIISITGSFEKSRLYPDSYILLNYTPYIPPVEYGEVPIFFEYRNPSNCTFNISIPQQVRPIDSAVTSYSGMHWTDSVILQNSAGVFVAYNLSKFSSDYSYLGDPFAVPIPAAYLRRGETNSIRITVGDNPFNSTSCSENNTFIYTGLINVVNFTLPYSEVKYNAEGCNWTIELESMDMISLSVPKDYAGPNTCVYTNASHDQTGHKTEDSYDVAMFSLLSHLDYNKDGRVFINFREEDVVIDAKIVRDIPYLWGPTIVEVRVWQ